MPPVTPMTSPTTNEESSLARYTNAGASSTGWAGRPIGALVPCLETRSASNDCAISSVHTGPGATALTWIRRSINSCDSPLVNVMIAPLVVA